MIRTYLKERKENLQMYRMTRLGMDITLVTDEIGRKASTTSYQIGRHIQHTKDAKDSVIRYFMKKDDLEPVVMEKLMELQEMNILTLLDCRLAGEKILDLVLHPKARFSFIFIGVFNLTFMELMVLSLAITLLYSIIS
ncbi:MAG: hypothetical protein ACE3L7_33160 [Candidatus Pristimantibacillus sp.]